MSWRVVWDAREAWSPAWPVLAVGALVALLGAWLLLAARRRERATWMRVAGTTLAVFGAFGGAVIAWGVGAQHARLRAALDDGSVHVVEGILHQRPPGDAEGRSWVVESGPSAHWYPYGRSWLTAGYRRPAPGADGLRDGMRVRIADVDGRIARMEVGEGR